MGLATRLVNALLSHSDTIASHERRLEELTLQFARSPRLSNWGGSGSVSTALLNRTTLQFAELFRGPDDLMVRGRRMVVDQSGSLEPDNTRPGEIDVFAGHHLVFTGCIALLALGVAESDSGRPIFYVITSEGDGLPAIITGSPTGSLNEFYPWEQHPDYVWPFRSPKSSGEFGPAYAASMSACDPQVNERMRFQEGDAVRLYWDPDEERFYFHGFVEPLHRSCH